MIRPSYLLLALALLSACTDDTRSQKALPAALPNPAVVARQSLNDFLAASGPAVQVFRVPTGRPARVRGAGGTSVWVPAAAFATAADGALVTGPVDVEIREFYSLADVLLHGLATQAGTRLLATGGMINLSARTPDGRACVLRPGVALAVLFPAFRPEPGMRLFGGREQAGRGPAQWQVLPPARATIVPPLVLEQPRFGSIIPVEGTVPSAATPALSDSVEAYRWRWGCVNDLRAGSEATAFAAAPRRRGPRATQADSLAEVSGYLFATTQLDWINCDRFLDLPAATLLNYAVAAGSEPVEISLVFKNFRGLLQGQPQNQRVLFFNVPANEPATLVAVRWVKGQIELATCPVTLSARSAPALVFHPVTRAELLVQFHQLDPQHRWETPVTMPKMRYPCGGL